MIPFAAPPPSHQPQPTRPSSNTAVVTGPMSVGGCVNRTPRPTRRSRSAATSSTDHDLNGMPCSTSACLNGHAAGSTSGPGSVVAVLCRGDGTCSDPPAAFSRDRPTQGRRRAGRSPVGSNRCRASWRAGRTRHGAQVTRRPCRTGARCSVVVPTHDLVVRLGHTAGTGAAGPALTAALPRSCTRTPRGGSWEHASHRR